VLLEYIRAYLFTGFPWALLGYSQYLNLTLIQIADLTGAWGVSFLVMMGNVAVWSCLKSPGSFLVRLRKCTLPLLCVLAALIYGWLAIEEDLSAKTKKSSLGPKISVIQGNIAQELKWDVNAKAYILQKYFRFTELAATDGPDLVIWPEAASPGILGEEPWCWIDIFSLARRLNTPLIIGTVTREQDKYFNSALLVDRTEKAGLRYDKLHLVPFGEFVPLKKFLPFLETVVPIGDISRGREYTIFEIRDRLQPLSKTARKFAVLICFEDLFPELSREFTKRGIDFLVNITNDAWYKKTAASYQHLQGSVFRAIENRRFLVRAANTGISGFIGSTGKILSIVKDASGQAIFVDGYKTMRISVLGRGLSFYTRFGDIFIFLCLAFVLYGIIRALKIKKSKVFNPSQKSPGL
jgi:apolipoprotein N-acyltransferase